MRFSETYSRQRTEAKMLDIMKTLLPKARAAAAAAQSIVHAEFRWPRLHLMVRAGMGGLHAQLNSAPRNPRLSQPQKVRL